MMFFQPFSFFFKLVVFSIAVVGNFCVEYLIAFFGIKYTFVIAAFIYTSASLIFTFTTTYWILLIAAFMIGFHDQCTMMNAIKSIKVYSPEPFATKYVAYAMTGYATGPFLWPFLLSYIINPNNLRKTDIFVEANVETAYFSMEIVSNYCYFMKFQLVLYIAVIGFFIIMFESPRGWNGVFWKYFHHIRKGENNKASFVFRESVRLVQEDFHDVVKSTIHQSGVFPNQSHLPNSVSGRKSIRQDYQLREKINLYKSENKKFLNPTLINQNCSVKLTSNQKSIMLAKIEEEKIDKLAYNKRNSLSSDKNYDDNLENNNKFEMLVPEDKKENVSEIELDLEEEVIRQEIKRDMLSANFWVIVGLGIIRTSTSRYYLSNFKLLGLYYFDDDRIINQIGSLSYIFYIVQGFTYPKTLEYFQIKNCYLITFFGFAIVHCVYCLMPDSLILYVMLTFIHRVK